MFQSSADPSSLQAEIGFNFSEFLSAVSQREEAVLVRAGPRCLGGRRSLLHSEGEVEPPSRARAEPPGGVQKDRRICRKPSGAQTAPTAVPPHVSHFALLWVSVCFICCC